jgi:predicted nucleic acid-binding OB-fold protein
MSTFDARTATAPCTPGTSTYCRDQVREFRLRHLSYNKLTSGAARTANGVTREAISESAEVFSEFRRFFNPNQLGSIAPIHTETAS